MIESQPIDPVSVDPKIEIVQSQEIKQKPWLLMIGLVVLLLSLILIAIYALYNNQIKKEVSKTIPYTNFLETSVPSSVAISTPTTQNGLVYTDPCQTGEKKRCIMENAYNKLKKSSESENYTIIWNEAFKICEQNQNDQSILFTIDQCKLDVCENLHLGDGNLKGVYPEVKNCSEEVMPVCPNGNILENLPCSCSTPAGPNAAYNFYWLENYWNKLRNNDSPIYCCSGEQQNSPC